MHPVPGVIGLIPNLPCQGSFMWHAVQPKKKNKTKLGASLLAQTVKNQPAMEDTWVQSLEKGMATHVSILAWRIAWTEEPGRLQSMGSQRVRHDKVTYTSLQIKDMFLIDTVEHCGFTSLLRSNRSQTEATKLI